MPIEITEKFTKDGFLLPEIDQDEFTDEINKIRNKKKKVSDKLHKHLTICTSTTNLKNYTG